MKSIEIINFNENMGVLIDVRHPIDYAKKHDIRSINIYADKLMANHKKLLNKAKNYYIICEKGVLSKKVVSYLTYFGYNVTQVKY